MSEQGTGDGVARRDVLKGVAGAGAVGSGILTTDRGFAAGVDGERYLVGIDPDAARAADAKATARASALSLHREIDLGDVRQVVVGRYDAERRDRLSSHPAVAYVEREGYFEAPTPSVDTAPEDHGVYPWGIERVGADAAHDNGYTGAGTDITIIDTGITPAHYALDDTLGAGKAFGDSACVEADRTYTSVTCDQPWDDDQYHGTHVAGTAGAGDVAVRPEVTATNVLVSQTVDTDVYTGQKIRDDSLGVDANVVTANKENVIVNGGNVETESGTNVVSASGGDLIVNDGIVSSDEGTVDYGVERDGDTIIAYTDDGNSTTNVETADGVDVVPESVPDGAVERIAGVAPEATLHAANVFEWTQESDGWTLLAPWSNTADAIRWATDQGHDVINASLGGPSGSSAIKDALEYATDQNNVVFVASAGNDGDNCSSDDCVSYPAVYQEAIAVAATNSNDQVASYSSRGPEVEVAAPGTGVLSTAPPHVKRESFPDLTYWQLNGTSMAAPHVAGLVALIKAHTGLTDNSKIREQIRTSAESIGGSDVETGNGLIDTQAALSNAQTPVAVSTTGSSAVTDTEATLSGELTSLGDSSEADVYVEYREQGTTTWQETTRSAQTSTGPFEVTVTGLTPGTTYEFRAAAVGGGVGDTGDTQSFTTTEPLSVQTDGTTAIETQSVTLQGTLDSLGEANTVAAAFEYRQQGDQSWQETLAATLDQPGTYEIEVDELTPETTYEFRALAIADQGEDRGQTATVTTDQPLTVTTMDVVGIDRNGATLRGRLDALGDADSADVFFEYRVAGTTAWTETDRATRTSTGEFEVAATGLDAETTYEFRAAVVTDLDTATGGTQQFTTEAPPLTVETRAVTGVGPTEATLRAELTQLGGADSADVSFEYGPEGGNQKQTDVTTVDALGTVETTVTGLDPETTYTYTAVAETSEETDTGETVTFETAPPPLAVQTTGVAGVGQQSATLQGELVETGGAETVSVAFEYGQADSDAREETLTNTLESSGPYEIAVDGLSSETTYAFRATATAGEDTDTGTEQTFTTAAPPLAVETRAPSAVGETAATLRAEVTELGAADSADVSFEYGPQGGNQKQTEVTTLDTAGTIETTVTDLDPETTYVYSAVAETDTETASGADTTFETDPLPLSVQTTEAIKIGETSATLQGELAETGGANTVSVAFEYWVEGSDQRQETLAKTLQSGGSYEIAVDGLTPETPYVFRAIATTDRDTDQGDTTTFTTDAPPLAVETAGVTDVGEREATVVGDLLELGAAEQGEVSVEYWVEGSDQRQETPPETRDQKGSFEVTLTDLDPETAYQTRAVAETATETATGETESFTTDPLPLAVETGTATGVGRTTATLTAEVAQLGVADAVPVVFEYWPVHGDEQRGETDSQVVETPQQIEVEVTDLMQDTTYEFRATADTGTESDAGGVSQFQTALDPVDRAIVDTTSAESATFSQRGDGYRLRAAGQTPWDRPRDRHGYGALYEEITGDVVVQTSIEGLYGDHDVRLAGLVVSNDLLGHGGEAGDLLVAAEPEAGVSLVRYDPDERRYETVAAESVGLPGDVRIEKDGKTFTAAVRPSTDTEWTTLGTVAVSAAESTQEMGLFATGGHETDRAIADFGELRTGETGVSLLPSKWSLPPNRTATFDLVVENASRGVQSYTADVAISDVEAARIESITPAGNPVEASVDIREDGSQATVTASHGESPLDAGNTKIATVSVETVADGAAEVTVPAVAVVGGETAVPYDITAAQTATITVDGTSGPPPVIGSDPPQDIDGDGLYEDINGDGRFTVGDVSALFEIRRTDVVKNNAEFFNFDGGTAAKVTLQDVVALSEKLSGSDAGAAAILGVDPEAVRRETVDPGDVSIAESEGLDRSVE